MLLELITYTAVLLGLFGLALALGYLTARLRRTVAPRPQPEPNAPLRLKTNAAAYRARFVRTEGHLWWITCPIQRDSHVPIRVGESVSLEAMTRRGPMRFRTVVATRCGTHHQLAIELPAGAFAWERRRHPRYEADELPIDVEGQTARLLDVSRGGLRFTDFGPHPEGVPEPGARVRVRLPWLGQEVGASVVAVEGQEVRLRFEAPIRLPSPLSRYRFPGAG